MSLFSGELRHHAQACYAIVASRWNPRIVDSMVDAARSTLTAHGVAEERIDIVRVPGAWEIPVAAMRLAAEARGGARHARGGGGGGGTPHKQHG